MAAIYKRDLELHQVDVNNAFTKSSLKEDIFIILLLGVKVLPNIVL